MDYMAEEPEYYKQYRHEKLTQSSTISRLVSQIMVTRGRFHAKNLCRFVNHDSRAFALCVQESYFTVCLEENMLGKD